MADVERDAYQDADPGATGCKTLWLGDVQPDWTEEYVESLFSSIGQELEVKLIRDRHRGIVAGYGFIDFRNHETAKFVLETLNGKPIEGTSLRYRLNWGAGGKRIEQPPEYSVFVGDLSPEVTDAELKATFLANFKSVLGAKVVTNPMTGSSKSFGFIRFGDERERDEALTSMNGAECCGRPIRVAPATKRTGVQGQTGAHATDPSNTTVFVGGINESVTEKVLRETFSCAGDIQTVTTPPGRGCAFVTFTQRISAEHVINNMQGITICGSCVRLSWGKSGRAERDRERERVVETPAGLLGIAPSVIQPSPNTAAATAAAAAVAARSQFPGIYGHPQYHAYGGGYPANIFSPASMYGPGYATPQQTTGLPPATQPQSQLPQQQQQQQQQQHQHQQAQQPQVQQQAQQQAQQQQQQYPQHYPAHSFAPFQGYGLQQFPGQPATAYTSYPPGSTAYADPNTTLTNELSQLGLSPGASGRPSRGGTSRGMYGPATRTGPGATYSLQDARKGGTGPANRN